MKTDNVHDLIIIGAGPAGLSASIYASRYKLDHLIFGVESGGQMAEIYDIENWPGDISVSGANLIGRFVEHVESYGVKIKNDSVVSIKKNADGIFEFVTAKEKFLSKTLIMAMGAKYRQMNIPGEKELTGHGVSYCATCDAMFFREKTVCVIGGGNSAAVVALELTDYAAKVYLICQEERVQAEPSWLDKIDQNSKIEVLRGTSVIEIKGDQKVEKVVFDKPHKNKTYLELDGVFIEVGTEPGIGLAKKMGVETDNNSYIIVKEDQSTSLKGVFAAGDISTGSNKFRQVLTAASEGAIAANSVYKMLKLK
jgi:thioredoxin-disulfide reductase